VDAVRRISELLDRADDRTVGTSMRIPVALRDAAALAVAELGVAASTTALTADALRSRLESIVIEAALAEHYERHPGSKPSLADLAIAAAEIDGHPLASSPDALRKAAAQIIERHPGAEPDDVLLWAEAQASSAA
jgi:hypothetical protein